MEHGIHMANQPVQEIRVGSVRASIWENATESGVYHSIVLTKLYKSGDRWQCTGHFDRNDLPLVSKVADLAHAWICEQKLKPLATITLHDS